MKLQHTPVLINSIGSKLRVLILSAPTYPALYYTVKSAVDSQLDRKKNKQKPTFRCETSIKREHGRLEKAFRPNSYRPILKEPQFRGPFKAIRLPESLGKWNRLPNIVNESPSNGEIPWRNRVEVTGSICRNDSISTTFNENIKLNIKSGVKGNHFEMVIVCIDKILKFDRTNFIFAPNIKYISNKTHGNAPERERNMFPRVAAIKLSSNSK